MRIQGTDLFCGVGGLTHGMRLEGIDISHGIDTDPWCHYPFEANNDSTFILEDIRNLNGKDLSNLFSKNNTKLLAGCAPCQPFSNYVKANVKEKDSKWSLLSEFSRLIKETRPELVTMENVVRLKRHDIYSDFINELKSMGYWITEREAYFPDYGVPQIRTRLILLASLLGPILLEPPKYDPEEYRTVKDAISHLPKIEAGETSKYDTLHRSSQMSEKNFKRIRASKPGGTWRDWNKNLVTKCHTKEKGKSYHNVYGRMEWDKPSPTITTRCTGFGNGRFGHPEQDRALSLREAALLQTFPEYYSFDKDEKNLKMTPIARLIGNALPVDIGKVLARSFKAHLRRYGYDGT